MHHRGLCALLLAGLCFATYGVLIRYLDSGFGPLTQTGARYAVAAGILLCVARVRRQRISLAGVDQTALVGLLLAFPLMTIFFTLAVMHMKAANALFILIGVSLVFSLVVARCYYRAPITRQKMGALVCALIGVACFVEWESMLAWSPGLIFALLSGLFEGSSNFCRKRVGIENLTTILLIYSIAGVLISGGLALGVGEEMVKTWTWQIMAYLLGFGLAIVLGGYLLSYGFHHVDLNLGTILFASELVFALILNAIFLAEFPVVMEYVGAVAIIVAIILTNIAAPSRTTPCNAN